MKMLLTSAGISNPSINAALVDLLGKPISESNAIFVAAGMHPFPGGGTRVVDVIRGNSNNPLMELGWKQMGMLELTALPTIHRSSWVPELQATDALLVWGGNVTYLKYWMNKSGLADLLPTLENLVYVGVSAGSIVMTPHNCDYESNLEWVPEGSDVGDGGEHGLGFVDATMWVHVGNPDPIFEEHSLENVERWAATVPVPTYALDDQSAIKVNGEVVEVISEGHWQVFGPGRQRD